jgi:hypothetical protein
MPRDLNVLAHKTLQIAISEDVEPAPKPDKPKNPAAVALGKRGGLNGGRARLVGYIGSRTKRSLLARPPKLGGGRTGRRTRERGLSFLDLSLH